ncbi:MAG: holo-ACP synthase [Verrucomicrobiia bacterium]
MKGRVVGHGIDLVENQRIAESLAQFGEKFLARVFTEAEIGWCRRHAEAAPHFAARWAAKEAVGKAFGTGIGEAIGWLDIEVTRDETGQPGLLFRGAGADLARCRGIETALLSLTHTRDFAAASVILVGGD